MLDFGKRGRGINENPVTRGRLPGRVSPGLALGGPAGSRILLEYAAKGIQVGSFDLLDPYFLRLDFLGCRIGPYI